MSAPAQTGGASARARADAAATMNKYRALSTAPNVFRMGRAGEEHVNERFPVQLSTTEPDDEKWALRQRIVNQQGQVPSIGQAIVPGEYWDYAQRKMEDDLLFQFQQFVLQQVDLSKPESQQWWYEHFPWVKDAKLQEMYQQAELQKRFAEIAITGPQNQEDMMLIWMRKQGLIKVAEQTPENLYRDDTIVARDYQDGFFSPLAKQIPATRPQAGGKIPWGNPTTGPFGRNSVPYPGNLPFATINPPDTNATLSQIWNAPRA